MPKHYVQHLSLLLGSLCLFLSCQEAPKRNCQDFKTGKFTYTDIIEGDTVSTVFERSNNLEIAYFNGKQDSAAVRWVNDCEYVVKLLHPKNRAEEKSVHIKILYTTDSSYTFEFSAVDETKKLRGTAFKTP